MQMRVAPTSNVNLDEKKFNVDSGASVHMMSKMDMSPEELETVKASRRPTTVITANGSMYATEEVIVFLKEMDMFVSVQLLEDRHSSNAVSGETLRRKEYSCEWNEGQNPNVIKNNKNVPCTCDNFVPIVGPGLSSETHLTSSA